MFAYCNNNPIIRVDASGEFFNTICGAVIGGAIAALTCGEGETPAQAFMRGAVTGAIAGAAVIAAAVVMAARLYRSKGCAAS